MDDLATRKIARRRRRRIIVFVSLALVWALLMTFGGCPDKLLLFPTRHPIKPPEATQNLVQSNVGTLDIWIAPPRARRLRPPDAYILEFTGNATRAEYVAAENARRWFGHSVEVWTVNYPGFGESSGQATLKAIAPAALAAYDQLQSEANGKPILVGGNSIGTTAALYVARNRPCAGMILKNAPPLRSVILKKFGWWNLWLIAGPVALAIPGELDSLDNAPHINAPALFLSARSDTLVQPSYQRSVIDAYAGPKKVLEFDGDHNTPGPDHANPALIEHMNWLWNAAMKDSGPPDTQPDSQPAAP